MDNIYIKLIPNEDRQSANHPSWVAPINPKSPEGKEWRIGVKIGETWYNQAGFDELAEDGQPTGGLTIRLTPNEKTPSKGSSGGGGTPNFGYKKEYPRQGSYANKQRRY